jgi:quinolinate synthase
MNNRSPEILLSAQVMERALAPIQRMLSMS